MVLQLAETLAGIDPGNAAAYRANAASYAAELDALDAEIRGALAGLSQRRFLVYHPAWGEFAATYGLEQVAIERDGKEPGERSLAELASAARRDGIRVIFVQPQASPRSAQTLAAEIGARLVSADPLAADYAAGLRGLVRGLLEAQR
jgi:zinc transport system substrate-binding protein